MCLYELILLYKCFHDEECFSHSYIEPIFGTVIYGGGGGGLWGGGGGGGGGGVFMNSFFCINVSMMKSVSHTHI